MSERLDPEEVKEITSRIFAQISEIITKYDGFVEKFVGDAVMALFGVPKAHEDDPVRAIRTAREIHDMVDTMSPQLQDRVGAPLSMHTGINTGLVVTGEVDLEKGTHGVAGDTINLASRLSSLAKAGEILVSPETHRQAEGHFSFEDLEPTKFKGKADPIPVYKVLCAKERPITMHRPSGLRADLIGRKAEMSQLAEATKKLREGRGSIISICGGAGTGKSRLVEEFRATLDLEEIQWLEGHAYAYAQNIPYFPLIDLLNRTFEIEEGDEPARIREKVESGVKDLLGETDDIVSYVGSLYALSYPEIEEVSPEFWRSKLEDAVQAILSALARRSPTVFCLEDLHWADPSFIELLRNALQQIQQPAIVLCVYRPTFSLFTSHQLSTVERIYEEIQLQELSPSEAQNMLESLLKTEDIPSELRRFVQEKAEGNPFYLEELLNSLIEFEVLVQEYGQWKITRPISDSEISSTIHGVISGRLDRLENQTKRILQEASVIGRAFLYEILRMVTELKEDIDRCLRGLEQLDLIRTRSLQPDLEYVFKHALTQEVVYNGLLKKERREIHERIGRVIEHLFPDRLSEFYETLAFHFKQGRSTFKAVHYLMKSGEKSLRRYSLEEAHQYYQGAYGLLTAGEDGTREEEELLVDLLIDWAMVFYYRGDFKGLTELLSAHEDVAVSLDDMARLGMFYAWLGFSVGIYRASGKAALHYLGKALELGEKIGDQRVIGYACAWLPWIYVCFDMEKAISFVERAQKAYEVIKSDQYLYFKSLGAIGWISFLAGGHNRTMEVANALLDFGKRHSNIRSMVLGHCNIGWGHFIAGDYLSAIQSMESAERVSADIFYANFSKAWLGLAQLGDGRVQEAEDTLREVLSYIEEFGVGILHPAVNANLGVIAILKGEFGRGAKMLEESILASRDNQPFNAMFENALGKVYLQPVQRAEPISTSTIAKNIGFLIKNIPTASKKAEYHLSKAIQIAKEIGAERILGQSLLDLGLLNKAKGRTDQARKCISEAIGCFEQCDAPGDLRQAEDALASLN